MSKSFVISLKVAARFSFHRLLLHVLVLEPFFLDHLQESGTLMVLLMGNHKSTLCICIEAADGNPLICIFSVVEFLKLCWFSCKTL